MTNNDLDRLMGKLKGKETPKEEEVKEELEEEEEEEDDFEDLDDEDDEEEEEVEEKPKPKKKEKSNPEKPKSPVIHEKKDSDKKETKDQSELVENEVELLQNNGVFRRELLLAFKELIDVHKVNTQTLIEIRKRVLDDGEEEKSKKK